METDQTPQAPSTVEVESQVVRALLSPSKIKILSALSSRKKMPAELQKEIGLSAPTIVEHLQKMETVHIVERIETGRKFVYYELTARGKNLLRFRASIKFLVLLFIAIPGALNYYSTSFGSFATMAGTMETAPILQDISGGKATAGSGELISPPPLPPDGVEEHADLPDAPMGIGGEDAGDISPPPAPPSPPPMDDEDEDEQPPISPPPLPPVDDDGPPPDGIIRPPIHFPDLEPGTAMLFFVGFSLVGILSILGIVRVWTKKSKPDRSKEWSNEQYYY